TFLPGPILLGARALHTATRLSNGSVLIAGGIRNGSGLSSTELYDPAANAFFAGASMNGPRTGHTATTLADSRILIAGGNAQGTAEIYNPATGSFALLSGRLGVPRQSHGAVLLQSGQVLIAGGLAIDGTTVLDSAELFDPASQSFASIGSLQV